MAEKRKSKKLKNVSEIVDNTVLTENDDWAFQSTLNKNLDLFGLDLRHKKSETIQLYCQNALNENVYVALCNFWNIADVRSGKGERKATLEMIKLLNEKQPNFLIDNLYTLAKLSRWSNIFTNFDVMKPKVQKAIIDLIKTETSKKNGDGLIYKWLPSINTRKQNKVACLIAKGLKKSKKEYRVWLSNNRKKLNLVETNLTNKTYDQIDIAKIPKGAMTNYVVAFEKIKEKDANFKQKWNNYLETLKQDKNVKIDLANQTPVDILNYFFKEPDIASEWWKRQQDNVQKIPFTFLPVIDISGSMGNIKQRHSPKQVAIALGLYYAERNFGVFKDKMFLFSDDTKLISLDKKGTQTLKQRIDYLSKYDDVANTNLDSVFAKIFKMATKKGVVKTDLPKALLLISDGQFDASIMVMVDVPKGTIQKWQDVFKKHGLVLPQIVYWNVSFHKYNSVPFTISDQGIFMLSGYDTNTLKYFDKIANSQIINPVLMMQESLKRYLPMINFNSLKK